MNNLEFLKRELDALDKQIVYAISCRAYMVKSYLHNGGDSESIYGPCRAGEVFSRVEELAKEADAPLLVVLRTYRAMWEALKDDEPEAFNSENHNLNI